MQRNCYIPMIIKPNLMTKINNIARKKLLMKSSLEILMCRNKNNID